MISIATIAMATAEEAGEPAATPLWQDPSFWIGLASLAVVFLFLRVKAHKKIAAALDQRSQRIADELDQARRLREEAQELLATYQRRQREAEDEAASIIEQAKKDAKRLAEEMREKIAEQIARRAKAAEDKIARAEAQALAEVRNQTVDLAVETAREIIKSRMDKGAQSALVEKAIGELRSKLH